MQKPRQLPTLMFFESHCDIATSAFLLENLERLAGMGYTYICIEEFTPSTIDSAIENYSKLVSGENKREDSTRQASDQLYLKILLKIKALGLNYAAIDISQMRNNLFLLRHSNDRITLHGGNPEGQRFFDFRSEYMADSTNLCENLYATGKIVICGYRHGHIQAALQRAQATLSSVLAEFDEESSPRQYCSYFLYSRPADSEQYGLTLSSEGEVRLELIKRDFSFGLTCLDMRTMSNSDVMRQIERDIGAHTCAANYAQDVKHARQRLKQAGTCYKKYAATKDLSTLHGAKYLFQQALHFFIVNAQTYSEETINCLLNLGHIENINKVYDQAIEFYQQALVVSVTTLGQKHEKTLKAAEFLQKAKAKYEDDVQAAIAEIKTRVKDGL